MTSPIPLGMEMEDVWDRRFIVILLKMEFFFTKNSTVKVKIWKVFYQIIFVYMITLKNLKNLSSYITHQFFSVLISNYILYPLKIPKQSNEEKSQNRAFFGTNTQKLNWVGTILLTQSAWLIHDLYWVKYATFSWFVDYVSDTTIVIGKFIKTELKFPICSRDIMNLENTDVNALKSINQISYVFHGQITLTLPKQTNHAWSDSIILQNC